ncbi:MAG: transketolase C-terminal domain-containing protein [Bacteriovoracaceae bacterium]
MQNERLITFAEAIREATELAMREDSRVIVLGEGVPDPKAIFETTRGLQEIFGKERVFDTPVSENALSGMIIGMTIQGFKPILVHQRIDFSLLGFDQIVNNAAKWYSMFGGQRSCPIVVRVLVGKGWGQGNQHSQNLQTLYAHIPGLKVIAPSSAFEAKGLLLSAIKDANPVIFIEHRWLHHTISHVPQEVYQLELDQCKIVQEGKDITIVTNSSMYVESLKATQYLESEGVSVELIDLRSIAPLDYSTIKKSLMKTQRLVVVDGSWRHLGIAGEILARVSEDEEVQLKRNPKRITWPDHSIPSSPSLAAEFYPGVLEIYRTSKKMVGEIRRDTEELILIEESKKPKDVPDRSYIGPF